MRQILIAIVLACLAAAATTAKAQESDRRFGGCFLTQSLQTVCYAPAAAITVGVYNMTTGKFSGGMIPGAGYEVTFFSDQPYQVGISGFLSFEVGGDKPNQAIPMGVLSFAEYLRVGLGRSITEQPSGPAKGEWLLAFSVGSNFGSSAKK